MRLRELASYVVDLVFPPRNTACIVRDVQEDELLTLLAPRQIGSDVITLLPYRNRFVRSVILEAKFNRNEKAIRLLGKVLERYLATNEEKVFLVPIPLSKKRRKERGYNQAELIARSSRAAISLCLTRTRDTRPQTSLSRIERLQNMHEAFILSEPINPGSIYVILDDVITTGATISSALSVIQAKGARVSAIGLAH